MKIRLSRFSLLAWITLSLMLLLGACAMSVPTTPEDAVRVLAMQRWQYHRDGDLDAAYAMLAPSVRSVTPIKLYQSNFAKQIALKNAEVYSVACEEQACKLRMQLTVTTALMGSGTREITTAFDETWIKEDGRWWFFVQL